MTVTLNAAGALQVIAASVNNATHTIRGSNGGNIANVEIVKGSRQATTLDLSAVTVSLMVTVRGGECFVEEGSLARTNLRIHISSDVALAIIRGEMDGVRAYAEGLLVADGETGILGEFNSWFGEATPER